MLHSISSIYRRTVLLVVFMFAFSFMNTNAQDSQNVVISLNKNAIGNLKNAITSENFGLRKSGIYLSGKHSVKEVSETLVTQLEEENSPELKILIMRVLYILDENKYMDEIYHLALNDENIRVRKMASAIYSVMQVSSSNNVADARN